MGRSDKLWLFLQESGVLDVGDEKLIEEAKKRYRKQYKIGHKQIRRKSHPEITFCLSKREIKKLEKQASLSGLSKPRFVKDLVESFLSGREYVPKLESSPEMMRKWIVRDAINELQALLELLPINEFSYRLAQKAKDLLMTLDQ